MGPATGYDLSVITAKQPSEDGAGQNGDTFAHVMLGSHAREWQ